MTETTEIKVCVICNADALNGVALCDECYHDADCSGPKLEELADLAEKLRHQNSSLTKERDELKAEVDDLNYCAEEDEITIINHEKEMEVADLICEENRELARASGIAMQNVIKLTNENNTLNINMKAVSKHNKVLKARIKELEAQLSLYEWRDIKDLKSGIVVFIFYKNSLGKGRTVKAMYVNKHELEDDFSEGDFSEYDETTDRNYWPEGWYEDVEAHTGCDYSYHHLGDINPTHFTELPTPPTQEGDKE